MFDSSHRQRLPLMLAGIFGLIFGLVAWDLASDYSEGVDPLHVAIESLVLALSGTAMLWFVLRTLRQRQHLSDLEGNLGRARRESIRWRERYQDTIRGLSAAINDQFERWELSAAEAEIAMLMLKGLGLKEIAEIRGTGERTVREQARSVYRKAGVPNRSALSAFFLEDLLAPIEATRMREDASNTVSISPLCTEKLP
ncbi:MAG: helix-turn-helix transcriptional regulator [Haliea sp.]